MWPMIPKYALDPLLTPDSTHAGLWGRRGFNEEHMEEAESDKSKRVPMV